METKNTYHNLMKTNLPLRTLPGLIVALCSVMSVQVRAGERAIVKYPRYVLIDLGTLGVPNSGQVFPARSLNNRGQLIALSATAVPDPECFPGGLIRYTRNPAGAERQHYRAAFPAGDRRDKQ